MAEKTRIAVLVSGGGTNLQALIDAEKSGIIKSGEIVLVCSSNPDAYALTRAADNNIETHVLEGEQDLLDQLESHNIELIILAGFMTILSKEVIKRYP